VLAVAKANSYLPTKALDDIEKFMHNPSAWSQAHGGVSKVGD
jgi:hypothetical protein